MASHSEPQHAAGPWTLDESTGEIVDALGLRIAKLPVGSCEERANARLIAASPLLFHALAELTGQIKWANLGSTESVLAALRRAQQALDDAGANGPSDDPETWD